MKQPRSSTSQTNTKPTKRPLLPTFRQSKTSTKVQQVLGPNKSQIYFDTKVIPLEIFADRKQGESLKITVNSNDIVIQDGPKLSKTPLSISSSTDLNAPKEWIQLNLGEIFHTVKVKKIGDENVFGICSSMISWENSNNIEKKISTNINVKEILKSQIKLNAQATSLHSQTIQSDKTKQMKAFVANLMSKKLNRRSTEKHQITSNKFSYRKKSDLLENKISRQFQNPSSSSISNTINGISIPRSFRRDPLQRNLKQSKITKSQKETSVGEQSLFINQKLQSNLTHISSAQNEDYDKKKQKFDSQPYFYQKSTITSQFSSKNDQASHKSINISRQQKPSTQLYDVKAGQKSQNIQTLDNKSQHLSQQEVQQDIKRSALIQQSSKNQDDQFIKQNSKKNGNKPQQSSQCFQSKQVQSRNLIQSSGTIYQSKYQ